ncbi:MAG: excinuclease ABC subunit C [Parcubacteria group bacterium CG1_02_37_51]|nr:MAG: excinuclease ABC subunit C [Parcubacteria group bacterium CG1_02_37_51]
MKQLQSIPQKPGIYQFFDSKKKLLYIGKAKNLRSRVRSYFQSNSQLSPAKELMVKQIKDIKYTLVNNETEALLLEKAQIRKHQPPFNIDLKDDKNFLYLKIDLNNPFPQIETVRKFAPHNKVKYFGPYTNAGSVHRTAKLLKKIFPYRTCNRDLTKLPNGTVCLQYHLGRCSGPCEKKCTKKDYQEMVKQIMQFLAGDTKEVIKYLKAKMTQVSLDQNFESAKVYRDQIKAIESLQIKQSVILNQTINEDFISVYQEESKSYVNLFKVRQGKLWEQLNFTLLNTANHQTIDIINEFIEQYYPQTTDIPKNIIVAEMINNNDHALKVAKQGTKKRILDLGIVNAQAFAKQQQTSWQKDEQSANKALTQLQRGLQLPKPLKRIEVYDISNIQGIYAVGSMIVFTDGQPDKSQYRKFMIKTVKQADDPKMMKEVLGRRLQHKEWANPDLIILDGGKTQLNAVLKIPKINRKIVFALAKKHEILFTNDHQQLLFKKNSPAYLLIQQMRNEAHRFAISYYRQKHRQDMLQ